MEGWEKDRDESMWSMFKIGNQRANIPALKQLVNQLIKATTQKTAGQEGYRKKDDIDFDDLDTLKMAICIEATALVLSGKLDSNNEAKIIMQYEVAQTELENICDKLDNVCKSISNMKVPSNNKEKASLSGCISEIQEIRAVSYDIEKKIDELNGHKRITRRRY